MVISLASRKKLADETNLKEQLKSLLMADAAAEIAADDQAVADTEKVM